MKPETKTKLRDFLAAAKAKAAAGARETSVKARALGRRVSSAASRRRRSFCANTSPAQNAEQVTALVNRALRYAYKGLDREPQQITDAASALRIGAALKATPGRDDAAAVARLAGEAAMHARFAMESGSATEWDEAAEYADDAIDRGSR